MTAPISAWVQYGVMVPGASLASTTRTNAFGVGTKSDARRIFDIADVCEENVLLAVRHSRLIERN